MGREAEVGESESALALLDRLDLPARDLAEVFFLEIISLFLSRLSVEYFCKFRTLRFCIRVLGS